MADIFGIGVSALQSLQQAITTTGHNIANVNTEGYSRQEVTFGARPPQQDGANFIGSGTTVLGVRRAYDQFLGGELLTRTSAFNSLEAYHNLASQLDNLVADQDSGLNVSVQSFFQALQDVSNDPASLPAREVLLGRAQSLADRVSYFNQSLEATKSSVNNKLESAIGEINGLASSIATINQEVTAALVSNPNSPPNDLLDKRDQLIRELSEKVGVTTVTQNNGAVNVLVGSGQPLVIGSLVQRLETVASTLDPSRQEVAFVTPAGGSDVISDQIRGGELQGILDFRRQVLDVTDGEVGLLVQGITQLVNQQHRLGTDLNGQPGGDFFTPLGARVVAPSSNTGTAAVTATIDDVTALESTDYRLSYDGAQWQLRGLTDNSVQTFASLPATVAGITISNTGTPAAGDTFLLSPVGGAAARFGVELLRAEQFAAAGPLRAQAPISNSGNASLTNLQVADASGLPLAGPITLTFDPDALGPGVPGFTIAGGPGGTLAYDPATESGGKNFSLAGFGDASFTVSGIPGAGDTLSLENNSGGVGDNSNALALAGLQTARLLNGGTNTFSELYGRTVANVGIRTSQARANLGTEQALLNSAETAVQSVSGVNLNEEAANLLRYQQAYQAAAQMIAAANEVFDSLLLATR